MKCNQCQQEVNVKNWKFCPNCGGGLGDEKIIYFFRNIFSSKKRLTIFFVAILFIFSFLIGWIVYSNKKIDEKNRQIGKLLEENKKIGVEVEIPEKIMPVIYAGENKKLVELKVSSPVYGKLKAEVEAEGMINQYAETFSVRPESKIYYLSPDISGEGYRNLADSKKVPLTVRVFLVNNEKETKILEETKEVFFYARNDIIWREENGRSNINYIARLVNKDRPEVEELVRKAADHMKELGGSSNAMIGTQGDELEIKRQLEAIFLAIAKDYKIRYVMAPFSYDSSSAQKIKTPEEVLGTRSGLCVELAILMASALENIGLNPVIVLTNDHAWAGVELGSRTEKYIFIETSALEKSPAEALKIGQINWAEAKKTNSEQLIKINELRAEGYLPIKY